MRSRLLAYLSSNLLNEVVLSLFRYFEVGLRVCDMLVKKFTFAISSPDEFLSTLHHTYTFEPLDHRYHYSHNEIDTASRGPSATVSVRDVLMSQRLMTVIYGNVFQQLAVSESYGGYRWLRYANMPVSLRPGDCFRENLHREHLTAGNFARNTRENWSMLVGIAIGIAHTRDS